VQVIEKSSEMVVGATHQSTFVCPTALLPFNITQVRSPRVLRYSGSRIVQRKSGGSEGEMEVVTVLRRQPLIDLEMSTPNRLMHTLFVVLVVLKFCPASFALTCSSDLRSFRLCYSPTPHQCHPTILLLQRCTTAFRSWRSRERESSSSITTSSPSRRRGQCR
jgi:hypothetical protein